MLLLLEPQVGHSILSKLQTLQPFDVVSFSSIEAAIEWRSGAPLQPAAILVDLSIHADLNFLETACLALPEIPAIAILRDNQLLTHVLAAGAVDAVTLPWDERRVCHTLDLAIEAAARNQTLIHMQCQMEKPLAFEDMLGDSPTLRNTRLLAQHAAQGDQPVLIEGEMGVGKSLFARTIHDHSRRSGKAFRVFHCRHTNRDHQERLLFGADAANRNGLIHDACIGTIVLDEVDALPLKLQGRLFDHAAGNYAKTGSQMDVRLICTTRYPLVPLVREGKFHASLYDFIRGFMLHIPVLRHRREDIGLLAAHFLKRHALMENRPARELSPEVLAHLTRLPWPGNIRQLDHVMWRAAVGCDTRIVHMEQLDMRKPTNDNARVLHKARATVRNGFAGHAPGLVPTGALPLFHENGDMKRIGDLESEFIQFALRHYNGHMSEVAKRLGIGRSTLYRKVQDLGLDSYQTAEGARPQENFG